MSEGYLAAKNFKAFKELNADRLAAAFHQLYGNQIHEAQDFFESEYEKLMLAHELKKQPPASGRSERFP